MPIITKYECDVCKKVFDDERKIANIRLGSAFGAPQVIKIMCEGCWKDFIKNVLHHFE